MSYISSMAQVNSVKVDTGRPGREVIELAARVLKNSGLVVAPTETRYGLLAKIDLSDAVNRLFEVKGRSVDKRSAIFISDLGMLEEYAEVPPRAQKLAQRFLPGPLTLVLKSKRDFGKFFTLNNFTGFRISSTPLIGNLVRQVGPLSATSANLSGKKEAGSIDEISKQFGGSVNLYIDGGRLNNRPSTVVQVFDDFVSILREGAISSKKIWQILES